MSYEVRTENVGSEFQMKLEIVIDDKVVGTHIDGGAPEDNFFDRDWYWVPDALEQAYKKGLEDGKKEVSQ